MLTEEDLPDVYKIFDRIAEDVPAGSDKVIFTPWLYGERTPVEDHAVRSGIFNQSLHTTREHLIRAVLEGVAYNGKWLLSVTSQKVRASTGKGDELFPGSLMIRNGFLASRRIRQ